MISEERREYNKKYREDHREGLDKYQTTYRNSPDGREYIKEYRENTYNEARMIIGKGEIKCSNCGCDDEKIVEINHIKGGGNQDKTGTALYRAIISGKRKTEELNLLCRVCNAMHYLELKYGELLYDIKWRGK